jgi:hypothetical protein
MRTSFVSIFFIIILSGFNTTELFAQSDYLVLAKGDTLYGKVTHLSFGIDQKVQLTDTNKKKSVYSMYEVKGFRINDDIFHLVKIYNSYKYMKLIQSGYLSYYFFQQDNQVTWDGRFINKLDGRGIELPNIGFKKKLAEFLEDCPDIVDSINSGELTRNDIEDIITQYNACIERHSAAQLTMNQATPIHDVGHWDKFEAALLKDETLDDKVTLLEMVTEIKAKAERGEKIPNFMLDGVKKGIAGNTMLEELLAQALSGSSPKE